MWNKSTKTDYNSNEEIKELQSLALQKHLEYLNLNSGFYKRLFEKQELDYKTIKSIEELTLLPTTSKADLAHDNRSFLCVSDRDIAEYVTTSGTLGEPITIALTRNDLDRLAYNEKRSLEIAGVDRNDVVQITTTLDKMFMAGMAYYMGAISIGASVIRSGIGSPGLQWENISRFNPTTAITVPSFLYKLASFGLKNNIDPNSTSLKKAICIGEPIKYHDFTPNKLNQKIAELWRIKLFSTYASTEMMTAFTECEHGKGGHLLPELIILEVLDEEGLPVADGQLGEVTVTPLGVEGMPLLRYRTGDLARAHSEKCSCGRTTLRLGPIEGRKNQMIKLKGTTLFPQNIEEILHEYVEIDNHVTEISHTPLETDHVKIYLPNHIEESLIIKLEKQFSETLRVTPEINRIPVSKLMAMLYPEGARKPKKVIDKRSFKNI